MPRPIAYAEEGRADRSEWWSLVEVILIATALLVLLTCLLTWLLTR